MRVRIVHEIDLEGVDDPDAVEAFLEVLARDAHVQVEEPADDAWEALEAAGVDPNLVTIAKVETHVRARPPIPVNGWPT